MSSSTPPQGNSTHDDYDGTLVDEWLAHNNDDDPNGPLRPTSGNPIPNNAGYTLK